MKRIYLLAASILWLPILLIAQSECTPVHQVSNGIEDGLLIEAAGEQRVVNDIQIPINTALFSTGQLTVNLLSQGGIASADIIFHVDNQGAPGEEIAEYTFLDMIPSSQEIIGEAFDYDLHEVVFDFPFQLEFFGTESGPEPATYWLQIIATPDSLGTQVAWETTTASIIGSPLYFDNNYTASWTESNVDGVFTFTGECTPIDGCFFPENITSTHLESSSFEIMWTEVGDATMWLVEYGPSGYTPGSGTETIVSGTPGLILSDFIPGYEADVYVKSLCPDHESGFAGPVHAFYDNYCVVEVFNQEPITNVEFAGIANISSVNSKKSHEYFLDITASLTPGETYPIVIEGYTVGPWTNTFVVFIDWNQDIQFNNTDERYEIGMLTASSGTDGIQVTGEITVPEDAALGNTRMRIVKIWDANNQYAADACGEIIFGQVEDYTVLVDMETSLSFTDYNFKIGPNPTNDFVQISSTENIQAIKIYNVLGQPVLNNHINVQSPLINMASLQNGVYIMEVTIKDSKQVFKIVKQ